MFRLNSDHSQVHNWSLKRTEEEIYVHSASQTHIINRIKNIKRNISKWTYICMFLPQYALETNCEAEDDIR